MATIMNELPKKMTITIHDPDVIEMLSSDNHVGLVDMSKLHNTMEYVKNNMLHDMNEALHNEYNFDVVPMDIESYEEE